MSSIIISDATAQDLQQIYEIEEESFENPYPLSLLRAYLFLADGLYLVAREDQHILGYTIGMRQFQTRGHVVSIATRGTQRRRGVGSSLLKILESRFEKIGCKYVYLEVNVKNRDAINFYLKHGYSIVRTRKNYYGRDKHAFVMLKPFSSSTSFE
ncbi:ribosomal protein S18-alanine N-acetyltransferase [Metallosphaera tengchongensis]|uniref:Ribosomal protein S18-alanine N-acetyltransferase n=1 Tax=Metallosphaera tengchongensis TaxID=1532350 RepID=A0A6N0NXD2_9CREN|nr:ribosomal protein S18-alanine N-acetyltransferase [Metallosphaera tengchongensis]QKQ99740.1 ribosomal protein S18-alanine N-acetyltransferase [Metallosphaera tengchongensis]